MKIFVIGYKGYIGSQLYQRLLDEEREVYGIGRDDNVFGHGDVGPVGPDDVVVNCAGVGMKPITYTRDAYLKDNTILPHRLAGAAAFGCIKKLIHLSSYFEFFQTNIYAKSKALASELLRDVPGVQTIYLYNVFGGNEYPNRFMAGIKNAIKNDETFNLTTPGACRDLVHIKHCINGLVQQIDSHSIETLHFGTGAYTTMLAITQDIKMMFPEFKIEMNDTHNYVHECYRPRKPYFKGLDLMADIKEDIESETQHESNNVSRARVSR